jgi:hypothetical protein
MIRDDALDVDFAESPKSHEQVSILVRKYSQVFGE